MEDVITISEEVSEYCKSCAHPFCKCNRTYCPNYITMKEYLEHDEEIRKNKWKNLTE